MVINTHQVLVSVVIDPGLSSLACRLLLQDLVGQDLGRAEGLDRVFVLQDVALRGVEHVQDLVLDVLEILLVLVDLERNVQDIKGQIALSSFRFEGWEPWVLLSGA